MDISADRGVEIAQGIAEIQRICDTYGLTMESNNNHGFTWFEVWASDVDDIEGLVDTVRYTFDGSI